MTGVWFLKKNGKIIPYSETQDAYEGIDIGQRIWEEMLKCVAGTFSRSYVICQNKIVEASYG